MPKPQPKGGSRKGRPNKITATLKQMILGALEGVGGQEYLEEMAYKEPAAFLSLLGKVLPTTLAADPNDPLVVNLVTIQYDPAMVENRRQQLLLEHAEFRSTQ